MNQVLSQHMLVEQIKQLRGIQLQQILQTHRLQFLVMQLLAEVGRSHFLFQI